MSEGRYIGDDFRSALDWTQERLRTTRPIAEATLWSAVDDRMVVWDDTIPNRGVYLLETDDEIEQRKKTTVQKQQKGYAVARKWKRLHFRNTKRMFGKKSEIGHRNRNRNSVPQGLPEPLLPRETEFTPWPTIYDPMLVRRLLMQQHGQNQPMREDDDALS